MRLILQQQLAEVVIPGAPPEVVAATEAELRRYGGCSGHMSAVLASRFGSLPGASRAVAPRRRRSLGRAST